MNDLREQVAALAGIVKELRDHKVSSPTYGSPTAPHESELNAELDAELEHITGGDGPAAANPMRFIAKHQAEEIFGMRPRVSVMMNSDGTKGLDGMDEEAEDGGICDSPRWVLSPQSRFRYTWDSVATLLIIFIAVVLPYRVTFATDWTLGWELFDLFTDSFFIVDIILNFNTAYIDDVGRTIVRFRPRVLHYVRTWFFADLMATMPWSWFANGIQLSQPDVAQSQASQASQLTEMIRMIKLLRLLRLLRVAKLLRMLSRLELSARGGLSISTHTILKLVKLLLIVFLFAHWNGCLQFYISTNFDTEDVRAARRLASPLGSGTRLLAHVRLRSRRV